MKKVVIFLLAAILLVTCIAIAEQTDAPTPAETETTETVETEEITETEETEEVSECPENYFVAGFVMDQLGYIPAQDEHAVVRYGNIDFTVQEMDDRRIEQVLVRINPEVKQSELETED